MERKKIEDELDCKSNANKIWASLRDLYYVYPKAFPPGTYKSIDVLHGDGVHPGSIRVRTYKEGSPITMFKEKIEVVDEEKKIFGFSIIGGDLLKDYKSFKMSIQVVPKDDDDDGNDQGSLLKMSCEYEKVALHNPDPIHVKDFAFKLLKQLDDYTAPQLYDKIV
ncbi:hypothetical protein CsatA_011833 [Cannabis sativa]